MSVITLRATTADDLPQLSELYRDRFGHPWSLDEWEWKYRRLPGEARSWVAADAAGRLLAHAGALCLPARWRPSARGHRGEGGIWQLVDFLGTTSGRGLAAPMVRLGQALLADLPRTLDAPWIFGFPSERHFRLGERAFGYRPLPAVATWSGELAAVAAPTAEAGDIDLAISDRPAAGAEAAWAACGGLGVMRSQAFLDWRYWARPGRYYRFYRLRRRTSEGFAVFAFVGTEAAAAELWLPPENAPSASGLAAALPLIAADLAASGLATWRFGPVPAGGEPVDFARLGLRPSGEVFMGYRAGEIDPLPAMRGFGYSMGDYDLV